MLDLLFNYGDALPEGSSFWQDLFTSAIGASIGAGGALFVYWLQIQRERDLKSVTQYSRDTADINYFKLILKDSLGFIEVQSAIRAQYATNIKSKPYETQPLNSYPTLPLARLEKVDHEKTHSLFLATQGENATENFKEIYKYIDFFSNAFSTIDETIASDISVIQNLKQGYIKQFADLMDDASKKTNKIKFEEYGGKLLYKEDALFSIINGIITDFHTNRKDVSDLVYHQTQFVRKLNEGIVREGFLNDAECLDLALSSKTITHLFSDIKFRVDGLADYLEHYVTAIQNEFENFSNNVNKIVIYKQKIRRRWYHMFYNPGQ